MVEIGAGCTESIDIQGCKKGDSTHLRKLGLKILRFIGAMAVGNGIGNNTTGSDITISNSNNLTANGDLMNLEVGVSAGTLVSDHSIVKGMR